jgi:hypothetical protein
VDAARDRGVPRRFTRSGTYRAFVPASLLDRDVPLDARSVALLDEAESARERQPTALRTPVWDRSVTSLAVTAASAADRPPR